MMVDDPPQPDGTGPEPETTAEPQKKPQKKPKKKAPRRVTRTERLKRRVSRLPQAPGVYLMKGRTGNIFYVGKASSLRNRVRSYFNASGDSRSFVALLDRILYDIEFVVTANEKEALLLENNLIKEHRPRYNVLLRDDKNYLALRLDTRKPYPRLDLVRSFGTDGARYFGPYHSARTARRITRLLNKHFQLRVCTDRVMRSRKRPCLQYQIGRCLAPCTLEVDRESYRERVADVVLFLSGREDELVGNLAERMHAAADAEQFEEAARLRDLMEEIRTQLQEQHVVEAVGLNQDVIGRYRQADRVELCLMTIRQGRMIGSQEIPLRHQEFPDDEMLSSFLALHYEGDQPLPDEILLPVILEDSVVLQEWLTEKRGRKVRLVHPQRGYRRRLVEMADRTARATFEARANRAADAEDMLERMQRRLRLGRMPHRIEAYDISNLQGDQTVGSLVVMEDGQITPKQYRHFRVKEAQGPDDYASLREVLGRRFARALAGDEGWDPPDLLVIDGGKGQLNTCLAVLSDLGVPHGGDEMDVVSLAKERSGWPRASDANPQEPPGDATTSRAAEGSDEDSRGVVDRVFLPGVKDPIRLRPNTAELFLLARLRDEAHRFAITYHRKLRRASTLRSTLLDISGVGPKRAKVLLKHFGSVRGVGQADVDALAAAPSMSKKVARTIWAHFHPDESLSPR
jgi:excinuclease ABC subunit C